MTAGRKSAEEPTVPRGDGGAVILTTPSDLEVVITRRFTAPRALVFKAWTEPRHVVRWWGPDGFRTTRCEIDLRPAGRYLIEMTGPDGKTYPTEGTYLEVSPPARLVFDQFFGCLGQPETISRVTVTFEEDGAETTVTIHTLCETVAHRDALIEIGVEKGWSETFEHLAAYLPECARNT
ncbi:SRPBCC domain-containing protein [Pelagibius sp. CAU 1746]|uniref:SRPBCC domain-containing protein n=1 Tax=Pelagibius sp. CAU 1746 TaxID=3140370 RepID=UPI00325B1464